MEALYDVAMEVIEVDELEEGNISTAAGKQDKWAVPNSGLKLKKRKMKNEKRKTKNKKRKMKNKKWKTKNGKQKMKKQEMNN